MDAFELHDLAVSIGGRDVEARLLAVVTAPHCDLGTARMVYWTSSPHYYQRYAHRDEVPEYERAGWDLLAAIEDRVARGGYASAGIQFDPERDRQTRSVRGVDWTADQRLVRTTNVREIPAFMRLGQGTKLQGTK